MNYRGGVVRFGVERWWYPLWHIVIAATVGAYCQSWDAPLFMKLDDTNRGRKWVKSIRGNLYLRGHKTRPLWETRNVKRHSSKQKHVAFSKLPAEIFRLIALAGVITWPLMRNSNFFYPAHFPVRASEHRSSGSRWSSILILRWGHDDPPVVNHSLHPCSISNKSLLIQTALQS